MLGEKDLEIAILKNLVIKTNHNSDKVDIASKWISKSYCATLVSRFLYAMMFFDAIHYPVRTEGLVKQRAVYIAIGIDLDGGRDVCGLWIGEAENSKYWLSVINELKPFRLLSVSLFLPSFFA